MFCGIVSGAAPGAIVARDASFVAFLDKTPLFPGHVLVVPRLHVETLADLPAEEVAPLFLAVRRVAEILPGALGAGGSFVAINNRVSQSVPHLHVHVVPRTKGDGLKGFFWPRKRYEDAAEMEAMRAKLELALA